MLAYRLGRYLEQKINETLACIVVDAQGREIYAKPFRDYISEENRDTFLTLLEASAFVLLIAARKCHGTFPGANRSAAPRDCDRGRCAARSRTVGVDRPAYKQISSRNGRFASFYVNEYTTAGFMSLLKCANWADKQGLTDPINFVFDRGNPKRPDFQRACDLWDGSAIADACHYGSITFDDDKMILPLQAADFIAYEICKVYTDVKGDKRRFRMSMRKLLEIVPSNVSIGSEEMLLTIAEQINAAADNSVQ